MLKTILDILQNANEEMTAEELRRLIIEAVDEVNNVSINVDAIVNDRERLQTENGTLQTEIERLKEENGRLFKKFLRQQEQQGVERSEQKNDDEVIKELEDEIDY